MVSFKIHVRSAEDFRRRQSSGPYKMPKAPELLPGCGPDPWWWRLLFYGVHIAIVVALLALVLQA